jgi:hypothetical protein
MWWTEKRRAHTEERLSEFVREMALLWTVFTVLDRVIADTLTLAWGAVNVGIGFLAWFGGVYMELRRIRE